MEEYLVDCDLNVNYLNSGLTNLVHFKVQDVEKMFYCRL